MLGGLKLLSPEEWFVEGHGIVGGKKDARGVWIPTHAGGGKAYLWSPPPVIADVALEECLKAVHKRTDCFHIFVIPRLFTPRWMRLLYKLSDFVFHIQPGSPWWPSDTVTSCPTQQRWFSLFIRGAEVRMGYAAQRNLPFGAGVILRSTDETLLGKNQFQGPRDKIFWGFCCCSYYQHHLVRPS